MSDRLGDFFQSAFGFVRAKKEQYDTGSRFMKMRVWIVGVLGLDVLLTVGFVLFSGSALEVSAWFEPGFPANMLVVKNETGDALEEAILVLDNRYTLQVDRIETGVNGYDVNQAFRDEQDFTPPSSYKPAMLELRVDGHKVLMPVGRQGTK